MFKNSFVKLACINPVVEVGLPLENAKEIVNALKKSKASINLLPELATTGYTCGDLFYHEGLLKENYEAIDYIVKNNPSKGIVVFGAPLELSGSLFNCAIVVKEHEILGVVENMAWFESKLTGEREYVFGRGGGENLAEELRTDLLAQIPLGQPDWTDEDFAPSVYAEDHPTGKTYLDMAQKIVDKLTK